jgi:hypothetical protein
MRRAAEAGERAVAAVAALNSPETNAWNALTTAERHPEWRPVPEKTDR